MATGTSKITEQDLLANWDPENESQWESGGKSIAQRTLWITTFNLTLAFAVWFVVSAIVAKLKGSGFALSKSELYWLVAMPGLAAGTLRLMHMFLIPIYGSRKVITFGTISLLVPLIGWFFAVQDPTTPYWVLMGLAFLAGLGGGNFSSFMPSTTLFFPKKKLGTALGIQAGIGNFGVSLVQFLTPWAIGLSLAGSALVFHKKPGAPATEVYLGSAFLIWIPFVIIGAIVAWIKLKDVPVHAKMSEQMDIFREKHTYTMTSLYVMTFGTFAGLAAAFPVLIKNQYGDFANAPDPLKYAFIGPLVGSLARIIAGPISDRFGGSRVTMVSGIGAAIFAVGVAQWVKPSVAGDFTPFVLAMVGVFFFAGIGNASVFKQIPMLFEQRKAAGVIGWTAAIAAYGPFVFSVLISFCASQFGSPAYFFYGLAVFCVANIALNWWYFARKGAEYPC
ncbi:MAG: NarK/NasA family nitrate transporter [Thermoleophilaceae bacterium]|nr:NarK/NasA family nitrate transporter [Thermoleophilaceae bacterium]